MGDFGTVTSPVERVVAARAGRVAFGAVLILGMAGLLVKFSEGEDYWATRTLFVDAPPSPELRFVGPYRFTLPATLTSWAATGLPPRFRNITAGLPPSSLTSSQ